jgi:hypothetical protein
MKYSDIENMTNEEAVDYYSPLTSSPIPCGDLENLLDWAGLAKRSAVSGSWEGSLIDFMLSNAVPALSDGLTELFGHLNKPRSQSVESNLQPWGGKMDDLLDGLLAVGQITQLVADDVVAIGGGYTYPDLDVAAVQAIRDSHAAHAAEDAARAEFDVKIQRYNELYNIHISPLATDSNADDAAWVAALQAMSDEFTVVE